MSKKLTLIICSILFIALLIGGFFALQWKKKNDYAREIYRMTQNKDIYSGSTTATSSSTEMYSVANVASHNSSQSCWAIIENKVYDLTQWISNHPGGERAIKEICGKDGSAAFKSEHGRDQMPISILETFKIGEVSGQ